MLRRTLPCLALLAITACSLNPQPLPPDNPGDAGLPNGTVTGPPADAASPGDRLEGGSFVDASFDATPAPVPPDDGGDAAADASDAGDGGPEDAAADAATDTTTGD
jgi:hypothetical protein